MVDVISNVNGFVNDIVWGAPAIICILAAGLYFTIRLKFMQVKDFGFLVKQTYVKAFKKAKEDSGKEVAEGEITPFQAAMASVSAVVGSGNIAGVATAIVVGGPGAMLWMLVAAFLGMATKFAEIALGIKYRDKMEDGSFAGGPMFVIKNGLGKNWKWLAKVTSVLFMLYAVVISAVVDTNTMTNALIEKWPVLNPVLCGVFFAIITAIVIFGGIKRIGQVCGILSPFMAGAYLLFGLIIVIGHIGQLPAAIGILFQGAFNPEAILGGGAGITVITAMRYGCARGIFSNEAGLGSASVTHACAIVNKPAEQAVWGPLEVFVDTGIVCTITGMTIILSGLWDPAVNVDGLDGVALTMAAFDHFLPGLGSWVVLGSSVLFGYSCLITYYNYVEKGYIGLVGTDKGKYVVRVIYTLFVIVGAFSSLGLVWDVADTFNGLVIIPNLIACMALGKYVVEMKEDFYADCGRLKAHKE